MGIRFIILFFLLFSMNSFAQIQRTDGEANFEKLHKRQTPQWFNDAKLGIFIHWGLYSVPAWATPYGTPDTVTNWKAFYKNNPYAEWYLNSLRIDGSPTKKYHCEKYGEYFDYYSFKDSLLYYSKKWNASAWAELFSSIGARYVVFTSKHHDGFTMYPSKIINPFAVKSKINSPRDFVGEIDRAVRQKGMKFGIYYSGGLDWTFNKNPITNLWPDLFESMPKTEDYTAYVDAQMLELIHKYKPDILWNDVNYPKSGDLSGIFSELFRVNKDAVINDRWGRDIAFADFTTPEYKVLDSIETRKWETCRGIGYSFGYNRQESDEELLSSREIIHLLIDVVSKNGNLLLNVGPKADGSIPENQLERLLNLGRWMKINGEGIYDTHPWKIASTRLTDGTEVRFTKKDNDLYVFLLSKPESNIIALPFITKTQTSKATLYGKKKDKLLLTQDENGIKVQLPKEFEFYFAQMIKITKIE